MPRSTSVRLAACASAVVASVALTTTASAAPPPSPAFAAAIERYNGYEGQTTCTTSPTPGVVALQELVTRAYPQFSKGYLMRACGSGGTSEHKDGRAWDWPVNVSVPAQKAAADELLTWLTAPDEHGNRDARLRRMGIMYVIWNGAIFKSYDRSPGWYPYTGSNPHTDHVHFSLGWAGARQGTSWWQRTAAPAPGVTATVDGLDVVSRRPDGAPVHRSWRADGSPGRETALGGSVVSGLSAGTLVDGTEVVAARGTDDQLYVNRRDAEGRWTGWRGLGGVLSSRPSVAPRPQGGVDLAVRGDDGQVYLRSSDDGATWGPWVGVGGALAPGAAPALAHVGDRLELLAVWTDASVRRRSRTSGAWGAWSSLGGAARGDVVAAGAADGTLVLAVRGTDDGGWVRGVGAVDSGWAGMGGVLSSPPSLTASLDGTRHDLVVQGTDGRVFRAGRTDAGWTGWALLG